MKPQDTKKLAADHWEYNAKLIDHFDLSRLTQEELINLFGYFYQQSMIHGYKHAIEDMG